MDILVSQLAAERFGAAIATVLGGAPYRLVMPGDPQSLNADIAFVSRDVTGRSTKTEYTAETLAFYDAMRRGTRLRWVHAHSAGADRPIYGELLQRGVRVTTSSGANAETVAHSALGGVLALARRFAHLYDAQRQHAWRPLQQSGAAPRDLRGQRALVVGYGPIGQEICRLLAALRIEVTAVRRTQAAAGSDGPRFVTFDVLDSALPRADWLILACPLTPLTERMIDARRLNLLQPGTHLINVARGEVVVEAALAAALARGSLAGAWLDVFEHEPLDPASPLWDLQNVLVSPHSAGYSAGHYEAVGRIWLDNLARWRDARHLVNEVERQPLGVT